MKQNMCMIYVYSGSACCGTVQSASEVADFFGISMFLIVGSIFFSSFLEVC